MKRTIFWKDQLIEICTSVDPCFSNCLLCRLNKACSVARLQMSTGVIPRMWSLGFCKLADMTQPIHSGTDSGKKSPFNFNHKLIPWGLHFLDQLTGKCAEISPSSSRHHCLGNRLGISNGYMFSKGLYRVELFLSFQMYLAFSTTHSSRFGIGSAQESLHPFGVGCYWLNSGEGIVRYSRNLSVSNLHRVVAL
jgi:hypothetical protein